MERTFIMVKPDGVQRGLVGEVISRFETKGLKLVALKMLQVEKDRANRHYAVHKDRPFFGELISFITASPSVAMVFEGPDAVKLCRVVIGATKPIDATPGTIRGDFALTTTMNLVHGSDSVENAQAEIANFFQPTELVEYKVDAARWIG